MSAIYILIALCVLVCAVLIIAVIKNKSCVKRVVCVIFLIFGLTAPGYLAGVALPKAAQFEQTQLLEVETKTETERFAEDNEVSVGFAESLETVLVGMELTDKSRVGIFHYDLSDVYNWKQIDDWANGHRYSAWMAQEHIFYIYEENDTVVGVRDAHGNVFYQADGR